MRFYDPGIGRFIARDMLTQAVASGKVSPKELMAKGMKPPLGVGRLGQSDLLPSPATRRHSLKKTLVPRPYDYVSSSPPAKVDPTGLIELRAGPCRLSLIGAWRNGPSFDYVGRSIDFDGVLMSSSFLPFGSFIIPQWVSILGDLAVRGTVTGSLGCCLKFSCLGFKAGMVWQPSVNISVTLNQLFELKIRAVTMLGAGVPYVREAVWGNRIRKAVKGFTSVWDAWTEAQSLPPEYLCAASLILDLTTVKLDVQLPFLRID